MACPDPTTITGATGPRLIIPTHVDPNGSQVVHPSVVHVPERFGGFEYWMAVTPFPGSDDSVEDPNIVAGDDGIEWVQPPGITNPIDDQPGSPGAFNSDVDLRLVGSTLFLFWRTFDPAAVGNEEQLYYSTSADGVAWAAKTLYYSSDMTVRRLLSPSMLFEAGAWTMWAVDIVPDPHTLVRLTGGANPEDAWSDPPTVTDPGPMLSGKEPWHISVIEQDDCYLGLLTDSDIGGGGIDGSNELLLLTSDDGLTWTNSGRTVIPKVRAGGHDALYRSTMIPEFRNGLPGHRVWYSAYLNGPPKVWNVFRTWIGPPIPPVTLPDATDVLSGSHGVVFDVRVLETFQTGSDPQGTRIAFGDELTDLGLNVGEVEFDATRNIRGTAFIRVPGTFGTDGESSFPRGRDRLLAPFGNEIFIRYGIDLGEAILWIPMGYFRITDTHQDDAPNSPVELFCHDRTATIEDSELIDPRSFSPPQTVGDVFDDLVLEIYPDAVIVFDDATGTIPLGSQVIAEKNRWKPLLELADSFGKIMFWDGEGILRIQAPPDPDTIVWELRSNRDGVLVEAQRELSREGIFNAVVVEGEKTGEADPVRAVAIDSDPNSPTRFGGRIGRVPLFLNTSLVSTQAQANNAARFLLQRALGAPYTVSTTSIVNPALRPYEAIRVTYGNNDKDVYLVDRVRIPLDEDAGMAIDTREQALNVIAIVGGD